MTVVVADRQILRVVRTDIVVVLKRHIVARDR